VIRETLRLGNTTERGAQDVAEAARAVRRRPVHAGLKKILDSTRCGGV